MRVGARSRKGPEEERSNGSDLWEGLTAFQDWRRGFLCLREGAGDLQRVETPPSLAPTAGAYFPPGEGARQRSGECPEGRNASPWHSRLQRAQRRATGQSRHCPFTWQLASPQIAFVPHPKIRSHETGSQRAGSACPWALGGHTPGCTVPCLRSPGTPWGSTCLGLVVLCTWGSLLQKRRAAARGRGTLPSDGHALPPAEACPPAPLLGPRGRCRLLSAALVQGEPASKPRQRGECVHSSRSCASCLHPDLATPFFLISMVQRQV